MNGETIVSLVSYGVIGLGALLAYFSYSLLRKEQSNDSPRPQVLSSIKVYLCFSFALCLAGLASEYLKSTSEDVGPISAKLTEKDLEVELLKNRLNQAQSKIGESRAVMLSLLNLKQGALKDIEDVVGKTFVNDDRLKRFRSSLERIDRQMLEAIEEMNTGTPNNSMQPTANASAD